MTFKQQIAYRAKAILAALGIAIAGFAEWLVQDPGTATAVQKIVPAPYDQVVVFLLGAFGVWLVHRVPNTAPAATGADNDDLMPPTTAVSVVRTDDGRESGAGR